jgi:diacylglycerol kinase (ATP)
VTTAVIVNLHAGAGAARRLWPAAARLLRERLGPVEVHFTIGPGHATTLAREFAGRCAPPIAPGGDDPRYDAAGATSLARELAGRRATIIAAGGDGTLNEVVNGALGADVTFGLLPLGSGGDFARLLGLRTLDQAVELLARGQARPTDVVRARFRTPDGGTGERHYLNIASLGLGARAASTVAAGGWTRLLPPALRYLAAAVPPLLARADVPVTLYLDEAEPLLTQPTLIANANGRYQGGGIDMAPRAGLDDGLLDITVVESVSAVEVLCALRLLYNGHIYTHPKVRHHRAARLRAESAHPVPLELDGEPVGTLPFTAELMPGALRFIRP